MLFPELREKFYQEQEIETRNGRADGVNRTPKFELGDVVTVKVEKEKVKREDGSVPGPKFKVGDRVALKSGHEKVVLK